MKPKIWKPIPVEYTTALELWRPQPISHLFSLQMAIHTAVKWSCASHRCFKINVEQEGLIDLPNGLSLYVERFNSLKKENNNKICYNIKRLFVPSFPVILRTKEEGDKIKLNSGTISLSDVLTNNKVNYLDRLNTIVVENNEQIINLLIYNQIEEDKNGGN